MSNIIKIRFIITKIQIFPKVNQIIILAVIILVTPVRGEEKSEIDETNGDNLRRLRLMTWNLENYRVTPSDFGQPKSLRSRNIIAETVANYKPNILLLQEIGDENSIKNLQNLIKKYHWAMPYSASLISSEKTNVLNTALLSTCVIEKIPDNGLNHYLHMGQLLPIQRGILFCTAKTQHFGALSIICLHLKSHREVVFGDQEIMREKEAILVRKKLNSFMRQAPNALIVVGGDLNDHPNSKTLKVLKGTLASRLYDVRPTEKTSFSRNSNNGIAWTHYYQQEDSYSRFDYFLINRQLKNLIDYGNTFIVEREAWDLASDHRPLLMTIKIQQTPE